MKLKSRFVLAGLALLCASHANAGITLGGTRMIYPEKSKEVSIQIRNDGARDIMIQSWLDPENEQKGQDLPFALTPSLSRLAGNKQQSLRLFYYGKGLPTDKESVFWLSVQEIPQKSETENTLQIALRQRIKVFYRPSNLAGTPEAAVKALKWRSLVEQGKRYLQVSNDSAYFISFGESKAVIAGKTYPVNNEMLSPGATKKFLVPGAPVSASAVTLDFFNINDYGAPISHHVSIAN
ncbi:molecular chaperone [Pseudomonas chlororaphis]|uniref:Molecular chaperone n=1 Tax=Pseudomonas chlororaphis TaxID=587753 RepID=A0A1Q8EPX7_9PSED|nr:molecular chaperone [Pseudomonas chlororaphis]OLF53819.1 molecular chaperone [Pseudomonas chlororaphis]